MTTHQVAAPVLAIPCHGIYADYDANAPDTRSIIFVATQELAAEVCDKLNEDPRRYCACVVDGWEHAKSWASRPEFLPAGSEGRIHVTPESALSEIEEDGVNDEDEDEDDEDE